MAGTTLGQAVDEVLVGSFAARFDDTLIGGGVVAQGASLAGREDTVANTTAAITIAGIPAGATVTRALLYWSISGGTDTTATINAVSVTGVQVAAAGETCWGAGVNNTTFRADVTARVTGNGVYTIGGLPSSTAATSPDTDGAALVVTYSNPTSGIRRRVMIRDGAITSSGTGEIVSDTFTGVAAPIASAGQFHLVVGDGQATADGNVVFNGTVLGASQFQGTDGSLWDTNSYNVTVPAALANATWSSATSNDCLVYAAAVVDWNVGVCGDTVRSGGEACEQSNTANGDGCSAQCNVEPGWTCTTAVPAICTPICGDGIRTGTEQCDQGNTNNGDGCSSTCQIETGWTCTGSPSTCTTTCGDGIRAGAEACDDGDTMGGDGCSNTCAIEPGWTCTGVTPSVCVTTCGDGIVAGAEACDDGGTAAGDGCSNVCAVEPGWTCVGSPSVCATTCGDGIRAGAEACDDGDTMSGDGCSDACAVEPGWTCVGAPLSVCTTTCGDGVIAGAETCDDGNSASLDGCSGTCVTEPGWTCVGAPSRCATTCGDGIIAGGEACDDGNTTTGDGCDATCAIEAGWYCLNQPSTCTELCGDGLVVGDEQCDDMNTTADDGCSATCTVEPGWSCTGEPSTCTTGCGDGIVAGAEACDDGNTADGDGCSRMCTVEDGWSCADEPSACETQCGDGIRVLATEECDDDNETNGDGCSERCEVEDGWLCEPDQGIETSQCQALSVAGGGCSTGGGGGLPLAALVVGLGLIVRRRRAAGAVVALIGLGAAAPAARAQVVTGDDDYSAERFQLAMDRRGVLGVEAPTTPGHLKLDVGFWLGYANDPLTVRVGDDRERLGALVSDRIGADLVASLGVGRRFEVGLTAPLILSQSDDLGMLSVSSGSLSSFGLGDVTLTPKVALLDGSVAVAVAAAIGLPTSGGASYFGDGGVTASPALLIGHRAGALRLLANLGYRVRPTAAMSGLAIDDELFARAGLGYRAGKADLMAEFSFATPAAAPLDDYNGNHAEARGGVGVDVVPGIRVFAAAGLGLAAGFGTPDWRALGGLWFGSKEPAGEVAGPRDTDGDGIVDPLDKCVAEPETVNSYQDDDGCPDDPDPDHDGMIGDDDACPTEPETKNSFQDKDGCPDAVPDTDGDGLSDPADSCPTKPEDADGYEDDDGCPDEDNDADTVLDAVDRCPSEAGVVDNGGCPDGDRDGDTVVDRLDNCPDEPGTVKNFGCKDKQLVVFKGGTIELLDVVYFKTNKAIIEKRSFKLLRNVASVITAHPEIKKVTVEGHTDTQGDDAYNKDLSQRRAAAVVEMLVANGVDGSMLEAIGYGEERPIADNRTKKGRAKNRRVEFVVEGITGNVQNVNSAPTGDTLE